MSDFRQDTAVQGRADMATDAGLRGFMLGVYNKLALGLVISGALAWVVGNVPSVTQLLYVAGPGGAMVGMTPLGWVVQFAPLVLLFGSMFLMRRPTPVMTNLLYWAVVATMGASLGWIFLVYSGASVATTFFVTAAAFAGLSLFGYTTKRDLSAIGTFLIMALIGLIIASVVNMFLNSSMLYWIITYAGVLIFSGLIAFDTQRLKLTYYELGGDQAAMSVATSYGALSLFINFVNLFLFLLRIFGGRD
ncbi:Bax inhibitor-1/YccA family protein [Brevundimonas aveniformis]|uniref:Bax inhibitor-1/YccA family protein n=1 Tax=Brevundimonas aveniformis TaxID=370977 RepID=UPI0004168BFD|nr:Bax inhibitor-1/YccA family protein [Brevundimonas aveniformis]